MSGLEGGDLRFHKGKTIFMTHYLTTVGGKGATLATSQAVNKLIDDQRHFVCGNESLRIFLVKLQSIKQCHILASADLEE